MEEIFIPASGMAMEDALLTEWLKQPGDDVAAGEAVAVIETDKAIVELSGTTAGRLSRHLVAAGERASGGATIAYLLQAGEDEPGRARTGPAPGAVPAPEDRPSAGDGLPAAPLTAADRQGDGRHSLSPRARRALAGATAPPAPPPATSSATPGATGPSSEAGASSAAGAPPPAGRPPLATPSANRQATAALVSESWRTVPHFSVGRDVRADGLLEAVAAARAAGAAVTVTDLLALALAEALVTVGEVPDIGLAVATDWGVLIPVLRGLAGRSLAEAASLRQAAVARARGRRLETVDTASVFATLSNLGSAGVTWFTGVVPLNQVALLTVGAVALRPAVEGRGLVVAPMFTALLTADHRRYDGADSAKLLGAFVDGLGQLIATSLK